MFIGVVDKIKMDAPQYKKIKIGATKPLNRLVKELSPAICSLSGASLPMRPSIYIANVKRIFDKSKL